SPTLYFIPSLAPERNLAVPKRGRADNQGDRGHHNQLLRGNAGSADGHSRNGAYHPADVRGGSHRFAAQQAGLATAVVPDEIRRRVRVYSTQCGLLHCWTVADRWYPLRDLERANAAVHSHIPVSICDLLRRVVARRRPVAQCGRLHRRYHSVLGSLLRGGDDE